MKIWGPRAIAEGIGTFFLVLIGAGAIMVNAHADGVIGHAGIALAFGFVVLTMIYAIGHLSGAHINPAVNHRILVGGRFLIQSHGSREKRRASGARTRPGS